MSSRKTKVIVTGGGGYIGSHSVIELYQAGYEPLIVDNFSNSNKIIIEGITNILKKKPKVYELDCCDQGALRAVFEENQEDIIGAVHFAALKDLSESKKIPHRYYRNNLNSLNNLLELLIDFEVPSLIFSSSCAVYGKSVSSQVRETDLLGDQLYPYAKSKRYCEEIIKDFVGNGQKIRALSMRYFNPIGAHPSGEIGELIFQKKPTNIMPVITQTALGLQEYLEIMGADYQTEDGTCVRDFINVVDLASAHVSALKFLLEIKDQKSFYDVFNVGTGTGTSVLQLIKSFEKITGIKLRYKFSSRRIGDVSKIFANTEKIQKKLGWKARYGIEDSIKNLWTWEQKVLKKRKYKN